MISLLTHSYFALFLIISLGIILGHLKVRGISLDISAVIFIALFLGHFGITIPADFEKIGLLLFIFTIGIQAGPGFFDAFRKRGRQLILAALALITTAVGTTLIFAVLFKVNFKIAVGLFTGALTSTPGLAAAIESTKSPLASIGYGIAYPFGVIGVILFVRLIPRVFKIDLHKEEADFEQETRADYPQLINQNFQVENVNIEGKSIGELAVNTMTGATISRVLHGEEAGIATVDTVLHVGDVIKAVGSQEAMKRVRLLIGRPTEKEIPLSRNYEVQWILVTNKEVVNKTIGQLNLSGYYNATVTRIRRSGIDISPRARSQIRFGDKLMIACSHENMPRVAQLLGNEDKRLSETDFLPIALGIVLGILVGKINIPLFGGVSFSPGMTGGVLMVALVLSRVGKTGPIIWSMSGTANQLLRQLGLLFFLAAVGTEAGQHLTTTLAEYGPKLFLVGALITLIPMFVGLLVGRYLFRMNFLTLLGVLTGSMTSTPGLAAIDPMTDCNAPHLGYATVYPIALVGMIIGAQIIGKL